MLLLDGHRPQLEVWRLIFFCVQLQAAALNTIIFQQVIQHDGVTAISAEVFSWIA